MGETSRATENIEPAAVIPNNVSDRFVAHEINMLVSTLTPIVLLETATLLPVVVLDLKLVLGLRKTLLLMILEPPAIVLNLVVGCGVILIVTFATTFRAIFKDFFSIWAGVR